METVKVAKVRVTEGVSCLYCNESFSVTTLNDLAAAQETVHGLRSNKLRVCTPRRVCFARQDIVTA